MSSTGSSEGRPAIEAGFEIVRHPQARRLKLAVDPVSGRARLVVPPRTSLRAAVAWANQQQQWLVDQRARLPIARPFANGAVLPIDEVAVTIAWAADRRRSAVRVADRLEVGGPADRVEDRVGRWLRAEALRVLTVDTDFYARQAEVGITTVRVVDTRTRWGSCASDGTIRYSWRLLLAPRFVRLATVAHEVAHRVHMNHGPHFHALVATLLECDPRPAREWLRRRGAELHGYGRSAESHLVPRETRDQSGNLS